MATTSQVLQDPIKSIAEYGGFHDAKVVSIDWNESEARLVVRLDDLNSNFLGLPEYKGKQPGGIAFDTVSQIAFNLEFPQGSMNIDEIGLIAKKGARQSGTPAEQYQLTIRIWPAGKLVATCESVSIVAPRPT